MSCREICRRTFRGCLRIPGCKTVCYKCLLRPCCASDSDDEKDEKDDEGYDSYAVNTSQNHIPEPQPLLASRQIDTDNHDYVNEPAIEPTTSSHVDTKLTYVSMYGSSDDGHIAFKSSEAGTDLDSAICNNNQHEYMNESVLFTKAKCGKEEDFSSCQTNGDISLHTSNELQNDCVNGFSSLHRQSPHQVTDSSVVREYETRSLESKLTDAVSNQQTLILLETDL